MNHEEANLQVELTSPLMLLESALPTLVLVASLMEKLSSWLVAMMKALYRGDCICFQLLSKQPVFRYNITGFVESLPAIHLRSVSACIGLPGHGGQVRFQNLPEAQPRSCLPSRSILCSSLPLGTFGKHCHRICRTECHIQRWPPLEEESGWFLVKTAKENTEKRY